MTQLEGKTALITGAGTGIGKATAVRFAEEGANVVITGRRAHALEQTVAEVEAAGGACVTVAGDVSVAADRDAAVAAAVDRWGSVDVLVNNAATDHEALFLDVDPDEWDRVIAVNLTAPFLLSQQVARLMRDSGGGSIIHITSIAAHGVDGPFVPYDVSKAALLALSRNMAVDLAPFGIRSNCVSPGATATELMVGVSGPKMVEYMATNFERIPMRRILQPVEIAQACVFFASDAASGTTGAELVVDGGMTSQWYVSESLPDFEETPA